MTSLEFLVLILFLLLVAGMVGQGIIFTWHIRDLEKMIFAGNPADYQRMRGNKKVDVKNKIENQPEQNLIEDNPIDIGEISGVQVDNEPVKEVKIYKT